jgi:hypothetical protein
MTTTEASAPPGQVPAFRRLIKLTRRTLRPLRRSVERIRRSLEKKIILQRLEVVRAAGRHLLAASGWHSAYEGCDRTAYVIGLYGTGRHYINELIRTNLGKRSIYLIEWLRYHPAPTSLIYSHHATIKYHRLFQRPPELTARLLQSVRAGFADLIFIYRHPLDSLLSNWVYLRTYLSEPDRRWGRTISKVYRDAQELCTELEQNFAEFKAFADGDPSFTASFPGPPFLSFAEFVEETTLFIECATLSLRLEDFMLDPLKEFTKIVRVMSVDLDTSGLALPRPRTELYRYKAVAARVPRFHAFIDELDATTRRRIEEMGYRLEGGSARVS